MNKKKYVPDICRLCGKREPKWLSIPCYHAFACYACSFHLFTTERTVLKEKRFAYDVKIILRICWQYVKIFQNKSFLSTLYCCLVYTMYILSKIDLCYPELGKCSFSPKLSCGINKLVITSWWTAIHKAFTIDLTNMFDILQFISQSFNCNCLYPRFSWENQK